VLTGPTDFQDPAVFVVLALTTPPVQTVTSSSAVINGDIYTISTETRSPARLGSPGLLSVHFLDHAPKGLLYIMSRVGDSDVHLLDETDCSVSQLSVKGFLIDLDPGPKEWL